MLGLGLDQFAKPARYFAAPRHFGRPADEPLVTPRCDPSQHNTLRHDQVERKRKQRNRAGRKPNKPYVKQYA